MGCSQPWVLPFIPYWYQFFLEQGHHIYGVFLGSEKDPAYMRGNTKVHFIFMFRLLLGNYRMTDHGFRYVISSQFRPYLLFYVFRFIRMEVTQDDRVFELTE